MTIRSRATKRMKQVGHSTDSLAAFLGITNAELNSFLSSPTKSLPFLLNKIASLLKVTPEWLLYGTGDLPPVGYGEKIRTARKNLGLTQEDLKPVIGVSRVALSLWESESTYPPEDKHELLCKALGLSVSYVFGIDSEPGADHPCYNLLGCNMHIEQLTSAQVYPYPQGHNYNVLVPRYTKKGYDLGSRSAFIFEVRTKMMEPLIAKGSFVVGVLISPGELSDEAGDSIYILTIKETPYLCRLTRLPNDCVAVYFDNSSQAVMTVARADISYLGRVLFSMQSFE